MKPFPVAFLVGSTLAITGSSALAGSLDGTHDSYLLGNRAALMGGAVGAVKGDAGSAWYNPAGLGTVSGSSISISASGFMMRDRHVDDLLVHELASGERAGGDLSSNEIHSVTTSVIAVWKLHDTFSLALGFYTPRADMMISENRIDLEPEDESGKRTEYHDQLSESFIWDQMQAGLSVGWGVLSWLRLGASLNLVYDQFIWGYGMHWLAKADELEEGGDAWANSGTDEFNTQVRSLGLQASFGLQFDLGANLHLGVLFRTPVIQCYSTYQESSLSDIVDADAEFGSFSDYEEEMVDEAGFALAWISPMRLHLAFAYELDGYLVALEGDVLIPFEGLPAGLHGELAWNVKAGADIPVTDTLQLGFGLFTDRSTAVPVELIHDSHVDFYGFTLGLNYDVVYELEAKKEEENNDGGAVDSLTLSTTIALRYALGVGEYGTEWHNPEELDWEERVQDVLFHEVSLHLGSGISF